MSLLGALAVGCGIAFLWTHLRQLPSPSTRKMPREEARDILGVGPEASQEEIQDAYRRLIQKNHPDQGGSAHLAAMINHARDTLLS